MQVAPGVCSVFKGVLPSDLYERYDREGGKIVDGNGFDGRC